MLSEVVECVYNDPVVRASHLLQLHTLPPVFRLGLYELLAGASCFHAKYR
jgi:hypothetical protein